jgi:hypothetical protein
MPRIKYSPQFSTSRITYDLRGEVLTATLGTGESDVFDFSGLPDGRAEGIETTLPVQPIVRAGRTTGILELELLKYIGLDASEAERFPNWIEVTDGSY